MNCQQAVNVTSALVHFPQNQRTLKAITELRSGALYCFLFNNSLKKMTPGVGLHLTVWLKLPLLATVGIVCL